LLSNKKQELTELFEIELDSPFSTIFCSFQYKSVHLHIKIKVDTTTNYTAIIKRI